MLNQALSWCPVEAVNWGKLSPTYPFRFNGPGYLYCMWCAHYIRLVAVSKEGAKCSDCHRDLAVALS